MKSQRRVKHVLLCVINRFTFSKGVFEPLILLLEFVGGLDGFVAFMAETFTFLGDPVEIVCEPRSSLTGHFGGVRSRLAVVGSKQGDQISSVMCPCRHFCVVLQ